MGTGSKVVERGALVREGVCLQAELKKGVLSG